MSLTAIGSTPANGSSSSRNLGSVTSARVISSRRRSPPPSRDAFLWRRGLVGGSLGGGRELGLGDGRARDLEPAPLAARELVRLLVTQVFDRELVEQRLEPPSALGLIEIQRFQDRR